jgi:hypothetical protein
VTKPRFGDVLGVLVGRTDPFLPICYFSIQINGERLEETAKLHAMELKRLKLAIDAEASQK